MKLALVFLFCACAAIRSSSSAPDEIQLPDKEEEGGVPYEKLSRLFSLAFADNFDTNGVEVDKSITGTQPRFPIIPPFEQDQVNLTDTAITIPPDSLLSYLLHGNMSFCNSTLSGLTSIWNDLRIEPYPDTSAGSVQFELSSDSLIVTGLHDSSLKLLKYQGDFTYTSNSSNLIGIHGQDLWINLTLANISVYSKIDLIDASVHFNVAAFEFYFQNTVLNGAEFEDGAWDVISYAFTRFFAVLWENMFEPIIETFFFMHYVKDLIKDCRLIDFATGDLSCLPGEPVGLEELIRKGIAEYVELSDSHVTGVCPVVYPISRTMYTESPLPSTPTDSGDEESSNQGINTVVILNNVNFTNVNFTVNVVG